jgi:hypothetical protein
MWCSGIVARVFVSIVRNRPWDGTLQPLGLQMNSSLNSFQSSTLTISLSIAPVPIRSALGLQLNATNTRQNSSPFCTHLSIVSENGTFSATDEIRYRPQPRGTHDQSVFRRGDAVEKFRGRVHCRSHGEGLAEIEDNTPIEFPGSVNGCQAARPSRTCFRCSGAVTEGADNRKAIRRLCTLPFVAHCQRANLRSWRDPAGKGSTDTHNATSGTRYRLTWGDQAT